MNRNAITTLLALARSALRTPGSTVASRYLSLGYYQSARLIAESFFGETGWLEFDAWSSEQEKRGNA